MPRQVYGRKTRAVYDPFAVFGNQDRSSPVDSPVHIPETDHESVESRLLKKPKGRSKRDRHGALQEKSVNEVVGVGHAGGCGTKNKPRARRKVIEDSEEEEEESKGVNVAPHTSARDDVTEPPQSGSRALDRSFKQLEESLDSLSMREQQRDNNLKDSRSRTPRTSKDTKPVTHTLAIPEARLNDMKGKETSSGTWSNHCASLLALSNHSMTDFATWCNRLCNHFDIAKIAEASFGEVYRLSLLQDLSDFSHMDESVFKIIPLKAPDNTLPLDRRKRDAAQKKQEGMSRPEDVANEVRLLQRMSVIPGYTNLRDVRVIKGRPPAAFAKAFKDFNALQKARKKEASHFPDPSKTSSYSEDQLWAVIEMQDAGTDLENLLDRKHSVSIWFAWDAFWQVVLSLAKGEEGAEFEHRDLHLGNICVHQPPSEDTSTKEINAKRKLNFTGLETTIIDYTISRALMQDNEIAYQDLSRDNSLFEGDSTDEYQYDIYRYMRGAVLYNDAYAEAPFPELELETRTWDQFHPISNLVWLHFILYKLLQQLQWPSAAKAPPKKSKEDHARWRRGIDLEHVLLRIQVLLDPGVLGHMDEGLGSARDLVGLALEEAWLDVEDVVGEGQNEQEVDEVEEGEALDVRPYADDEEPEVLARDSPARRRPRARRKQ